MPIGWGEDLASWEAPTWEDATWGTLLSGWEIALSTLGVLPACLEELLGVLPAWELLLACEALSLAEHLTAWGRTTLSAWGRVLSSGEAWELPAWEITLSAWERVLSTREAWELPGWEISLSGWEGVLSHGEAWELPAWEDWVLPAWEVMLSAWEGLLSTREAWGLPAWEIELRGRALSAWEAWGEALGVDLPAWELLAACEALVAWVTCLLFAQG